MADGGETTQVSNGTVDLGVVIVTLGCAPPISCYLLFSSDWLLRLHLGLEIVVTSKLIIKKKKMGLKTESGQTLKIVDF